MFDTNIKSLFDLQKAFPTEQKCIDYLEYLIWNGKPVSPFSPTGKVYKCKNNRYKCVDTNRYFNIRTKSCFENTKIPLQKWMFALWILSNASKGYTSVQLAKDLGITQPNAWHLAHRIRACFKIENNVEDKFEGIVEGDESFFGGKNKNRHKDKKVEASQGRAFKDKTPVIGVLQRGTFEVKDGKRVILSCSKVKCIVANNTKKESIQPFIRKVVKKDSVLISDEWMGYRGLENYYDHHVVDHGKKQYVDFDNPEIHSNGIENYWASMKRGYNGLYNWWSRKHMQKYCDEYVFRFNTRSQSQTEKFKYLIQVASYKTKK